jgi:hypothetical protein
MADFTFRGERLRLFFHPCGSGDGDISGLSFGLLFPEREISAMARTSRSFTWAAA